MDELKKWTSSLEYEKFEGLLIIHFTVVHSEKRIHPSNNNFTILIMDNLNGKFSAMVKNYKKLIDIFFLFMAS